MPSIVHNPHRLPTQAEAHYLARAMHQRAERDPDGDEGDHLIGNLLDAYGKGLLVLGPNVAKPRRIRTEQPPR